MFEKKSKNCIVCGNPIKEKRFINGLFSLEDISEQDNLCEKCKESHIIDHQSLFRTGYIYAINSECVRKYHKDLLSGTYPLSESLDIFFGICTEDIFSGEIKLIFPKLHQNILDYLYSSVTNIVGYDGIIHDKLKDFNILYDFIEQTVEIKVEDIQKPLGMVLINSMEPNTKAPIDITGCVYLTLNEIVSRTNTFVELLRLDTKNNLLFIIDDKSFTRIDLLLNKYIPIEKIDIDTLYEYENSIGIKDLTDELHKTNTGFHTLDFNNSYMSFSGSYDISNDSTTNYYPTSYSVSWKLYDSS